MQRRKTNNRYLRPLRNTERPMRTNLLKCIIKESFVPTRVNMNMAVEVDNILTGYFLLSDIFESKVHRTKTLKFPQNEIPCIFLVY